MHPLLEQEQQAFADRFQGRHYERLLELVASRAGVKPGFRLAEMPVFFRRDALEEVASHAMDLTQQLVGNPEYLARAAQEIPTRHLCPGQTEKPLFVQADFSLVRENERFSWKLVEIQGFPSLYAFQPELARAYTEAYELDGYQWLNNLSQEEYWTLLRDAIIGPHEAEQVILLEIRPEEQKTLPDFRFTEQHLGIPAVCISKVRKEGRKLFYRQHGRWIPIARIYNRLIVDELDRCPIDAGFSFTDDLDVEWAGHPNWYFLISKFSLPFLKHASVPASRFLHHVDKLPEDLDRYVLKPLYSFAGLGVKVGLTREDVESIPQDERHLYLLQERMQFEPIVVTPFGKSIVEVRVMLLWHEQLRPLTYILRTGRGKMMGVDFNKNLEWVGASAALFR